MLFHYNGHGVPREPATNSSPSPAFGCATSPLTAVPFRLAPPPPKARPRTASSGCLIRTTPSTSRCRWQVSDGRPQSMREIWTVIARDGPESPG